MDNGIDMIGALESSVIMSSVVLSALCLLSAVALYLSKRTLDERYAEVMAARDLMEVHYAALDSVVNDPSVSEDLKETLLTLSLSVTDREIAYECAKRISKESAMLDVNDEDSKKLAAELRDLGSHRPDMREAFSRAVVSGFTSMMFRWPYTRQAIVKLHVANTLRAPIDVASTHRRYREVENDERETVDFAARVLKARAVSSLPAGACAA